MLYLWATALLLEGLEPSTDVSRAFTTPQTFQKFFRSPNPPFLFAGPFWGRSSLPAHTRMLRPAHSRTPVACIRQPRCAPPKSAPKKVPGGINVHGFSGLEPEPFGLSRRSIRELHHPGTLNPRRLLWIETIRRIRYSRANQQTARPERLGIVLSWLLSSCLISALSLSEDPGFHRDI
jgi:hypothetical protein